MSEDMDLTPGTISWVKAEDLASVYDPHAPKWLMLHSGKRVVKEPSYYPNSACDPNIPVQVIRSKLSYQSLRQSDPNATAGLPDPRLAKEARDAMLKPPCGIGKTYVEPLPGSAAVVIAQLLVERDEARAEVESLKRVCEGYGARIEGWCLHGAALMDEIASLTERLAQYEPPPPPAPRTMLDALRADQAKRAKA